LTLYTSIINLDLQIINSATPTALPSHPNSQRGILRVEKNYAKQNEDFVISCLACVCACPPPTYGE
jgi:hypothetical protein